MITFSDPLSLIGVAYPIDEALLSLKDGNRIVAQIGPVDKFGCRPCWLVDENGLMIGCRQYFGNLLAMTADDVFIGLAEAL